MSREQLFDFLCQHFGNEKENPIESFVFKHAYDYLVVSSVKEFYSYLNMELTRYRQLLHDFDELEFNGQVLLAMASIINIMQYINTYTGKEIFKCSYLEF